MTQETKLGNKGLDTSNKIPVSFYCSDELKRITSSQAALSRPFNLVDLSAPHKINLHMRSYVDYYGGYAEHGRNVLFGLGDTGNYNIKLTPIPTPVDIDPIVWDKCNWYTKNPNFKKENSTFLTIAGPGWMQEKFLSENRFNIGWTMVESLKAQPEILKWLENCDEVWCPTDTDIKRFEDANVTKQKVHLGYDPKLYNVHTKPLDISNLRGRYVFGVLGSWNKRKNVKGIIQAFVKAFTPEDNVSLLLCCKYGTRPFGEEKNNEERWTIKYELDQYLHEIGMEIGQCPHLCLLDVPVHESVMPHLLARFNCLVGFSMGESTWLPGLQAMAMDKPIIQLAADTNGFMEYLETVGYLCEKVTYVEADQELYDGTSEYYKGEQFAEGDIDELVGRMEYVYNAVSSDRGTLKRHLGVIKAQDWTWKNSIEIVDKLLRR